ncbi:MAG TPA: mercury methylation corrinoid protein HgcA [Syntrophales bacterium]|nr:mercury methylation corrinoid protein HgcA [Syntrophales bacterium]
MSQNCCDIKLNKDSKDGVETAPVVFPMISSLMETTEAQTNLPSLEQPFVVGSIDTPVGQVAQVSSTLTWRDRWGTVKARWGVGRMNYTVEPGLYALGNPDSQSRVLVTANYKMSFDRLRETLAGRDVWLLVLDTKGINVWCAAGKGTFGTEELVRRIALSGLNKIVSHRELMLPQLSGPGVAAHLVKKFSGFRIHYGPIRASDLAAYLEAGLKATPEMRLKTFPLRERIALIPIEIVAAFKVSLLILLTFFLLGGLGGPDEYWTNALNYGLFAIAALLSAILAGAVLTPILLPVLPGRAFSLKGCIVGAAVSLTLLVARNPDLTLWPGRLEMAAWLLLVPALAAYLAMNFTGASTYTSLSGVKREMRTALPLQIGAGIAGLGLWLVSRFIA